MSMDNVHQCMRMFEERLEQFNDQLRQSFEEIRQLHDQLNPLWQDSMRAEYDQRYKPLEEGMETYCNQVGPQHVDTLQVRVGAARRYVYGS